MCQNKRSTSSRSHLGPGRSLDSLGGKANDAACKAGAGVASRLGREALLAGLGVVALAQVVGKLVDNDRPDGRTEMMHVSWMGHDTTQGNISRDGQRDLGRER
jgi:hypothetical protein